MSKIYQYPIDVSVNDNEDMTLKVEFLDAFSRGLTKAYLLTKTLCTIKDANSGNLGNSDSLVNKKIVIESRPKNLAKQVESIRANYYINDELIVEHENKKTEEKIPNVEIIVNFKKTDNE
jgi:hypothetical protein